MSKAEKIEKKEYTKIAHTITFLTTPAITGTVLLFYALYKFSPSTEAFYQTFFIVFVFSVILPVLLTFYLLKKKKIANFHIKERRERAVPFAFALISSTVSLLAMKYISASAELTEMVITLYLMALGYITITFLKFKVSGHTFIFTSIILILATFSDIRLLYFLPLVIPIAWSRVYLEDHSTGEVVGGIAYAIVSFILFSMLLNG